jgi:hypothetical protein
MDAHQEKSSGLFYAEKSPFFGSPAPFAVFCWTCGQAIDSLGQADLRWLFIAYVSRLAVGLVGCAGLPQDICLIIRKHFLGTVSAVFDCRVSCIGEAS